MDICKNKKSGKTFVKIDDHGPDKALMITPHGEVKALEVRLFSDFRENQPVHDLLNRGEISHDQLRVYSNYVDSN